MSQAKINRKAEAMDVERPCDGTELCIFKNQRLLGWRYSVRSPVTGSLQDGVQRRGSGPVLSSPLKSPDHHPRIAIETA